MFRTNRLILNKPLSSGVLYLLLLFCLILALIMRGGYWQLTANRSMINWVERIFNGRPADDIFVPDNASVLGVLPDSVFTVFGKLHFAKQEYTEAAIYYQRASNLIETNPFGLAELAVALSQTNQFADVVALHQEKGEFFLWNQQVRDAVLLAYLHGLDNEQYTFSEIQPIVQTLAPESLYIKSQGLLRKASVARFLALPLEYQMQLRRFPVEAVLPEDERLLDYAVRFVPDLVNNDVWDDDRLARVVKLWLWQYPDSSAVDVIFANINEFEGVAIDWVWLERERELRRNQGSEGGTSLFSELNDSNAQSNLLINGGFDIVDYRGLVGWTSSDYISHGINSELRPAFITDVDRVVYITPPHALRIDGLWDEDISGFSGIVTLMRESGGTYVLPLAPGKYYRLAGYYRTAGAQEKASIYVGRPGIRFAEVSLAPTAGEWQSFEYIGCYMSEQAQTMQLIARLWSKGSVWFDELVLEPIESLDTIGECGSS